MKRALLCALLLSPSLATARVPDDSVDARAIMEEVEGRPRIDKVSGKLHMTLTDRSGRSRARALRTWTLLFAGGTKQRVVFESPADVRGTGLLTVDYDDGAKDDEQWLYLPALHKSTRIAGGERSGAFMGSDFSYADLTRADPSQYEYKLIESSAPVEGELCWVIEATPRTEKRKAETGYLKTHVWVSKKRRVLVQAKMWVLEGRKLKFVTFKDYRDIGGVPTPHALMARTRRGETTESTTLLSFSELKANDPAVTEAELSPQRLEQGL